MQPILESKFVYKGYPCVVLFMPGMYRCGYVGIPISHKFAKKSIDDLMDIDCHGGITYSEPSLHGCEDDDTWWTAQSEKYVKDECKRIVDQIIKE